MNDITLAQLLEVEGLGNMSIRSADEIQMVLVEMPVLDTEAICEDPAFAANLRQPFRPIIVLGSADDPFILDGNHRYVAALNQGIPTIPAWRAVDSVQAERLAELVEVL